MKREIKFRAWLPEWNQMVIPSIIDHNTNSIKITEFNNGNWYGVFELMEYTGLKDKNDKEIFEGDIVKVPESYGGDHLYPETTGIVFFESGEFIIDTCGRSHADYSWDETEIIGNIFKNPELIN